MKMLGTAILIKPDKLPERTPSGKLIINPNSQELLPQWGEVIDHGTECSLVKIGERVIFPRKSANVMVIDGVDFFITNEHRLSYIQEKLNNNEI
jgi:co-chaperonin GroES (HSP10)